MTTERAIDASYLAAALARAGRPVPHGGIETQELHGGRTGARVVRVAAGGRSYVVKMVPGGGWRRDAMGVCEGAEARLWTDGLTKDLGPGVRCPVIDVDEDPATGLRWMLMDDIGAGIQPRGRFLPGHTHYLFQRLAPLQRSLFHSRRLETPALPAVLGPTELFATPYLHVVGRRPSPAAWVADMLVDVPVVGAFAPLFVGLLRPSLADQFFALVADEGWRRELAALPRTLLHGDLRRANIAFELDGVVLIDWELASAGPPGVDLQWHCFLTSWAYPADGVEPGAENEEELSVYLEAFEEAAFGKVDRAQLRRGWELGWIRTMAMASSCLADPLYPDGGSAEDRARLADVATRAVERALRFAR